MKNMKEIEVKAKLLNRKLIMKRLNSLGCNFSKAISQQDVIYTQRAGSLEKFKSNDLYLRIRIKNKNKAIFTLKKNGINGTDKIEYETEIEFPLEMENILLLMGYKEAVKVDKIRMTTKYKGFEICIDEVKNLGSFIEMEKLTKKGDSEKIQEQMFKFLESIGIKKEDRIKVGYDVLMLSR
jgi:adenylate cyclase, class 2